MGQTGKVMIVGAGPGDPALLTVKAFLCLQKADVVVYDRLVDERILSLASSSSELIYVGKENDNHTLEQEAINNLLVEKALDGKLVIRLKGGDPFIFGRGGEEAEALHEAGIPFEIVPGITSAIAAPAYAGIPLTHREYASSFLVLTGHPAKGLSNIPWEKLAHGAAGTLVFLMALGSLPQIVNNLISHGMNPETPVALIRWGSRADQQTVVGTLHNIRQKVIEAKLTPPVVLVIGEVVRLREKLRWFDKQPLLVGSNPSPESIAHALSPHFQNEKPSQQ
ncbi:MAG: uroporphyrinogen-III C-methyltransferase [Chloroflexi bacterium]|nr:uroporphyrinogen-III C-methyltransferase [Chloroflexota bacterium]